MVQKTDAWRDLPKYVAQALNLARNKKEWTQEQVAEALSDLLGDVVRQSYVSKIETAGSEVSWFRFAAFCKVLGQRPSEVLQIAESLSNKTK